MSPMVSVTCHCICEVQRLKVWLFSTSTHIYFFHRFPSLLGCDTSSRNCSHSYKTHNHPNAVVFLASPRLFSLSCVCTLTLHIHWCILASFLSSFCMSMPVTAYFSVPCSMAAPTWASYNLPFTLSERPFVPQQRSGLLELRSDCYYMQQTGFTIQ